MSVVFLENDPSGNPGYAYDNITLGNIITQLKPG
jgi:hypothetical protein